MTDRWSHDPRYSHGYLVPLFAVALIWMDRQHLRREALLPSAWGTFAIAAATGVYLVAAGLYNDWLAGCSLILGLAGLCILAGGWALFRRCWRAIGFLVFMVPLPYRAELALGGPLQRIATLASERALQTLGVPALAEGNTIRLSLTRVGVVEACSGLSMLLLFLAISTAVAMLLERPWPAKLLLLVGSIPIALIANITRIVATGALNEWVGEHVGRVVFHDLAGWLMMPLALLLTGLELWIWDRLVACNEPHGASRSKPRQVESVAPARCAPIPRVETIPVASASMENL
jgi:exosortase